MRNKGLIAWTFCCLLISAASLAQDKTVPEIPIGDNSRIVYHLDKGTYNIIWKGKLIVQDAHASYQADRAGDSRQAGRASYRVSDMKTNLGKTKLYNLSFAKDPLLTQLFYVLPGRDQFITQLQVRNAGPVHSMTPFVTDSLYWQHAGDNRALFIPFDNDMWAEVLQCHAIGRSSLQRQ